MTTEQLVETLRDPRVPWIPWIGGGGARSVLVADLLEFLAGADVRTTERELDRLVEALGGKRTEKLQFIWLVNAWRRWRKRPDSVLATYELPAEIQVPSYRQRLHVAKAPKASQ